MPKTGKIDVRCTIGIPGKTELVEPLEESCVWRQVRGAAVEVSGLNNTAATKEKVFVNHFPFSPIIRLLVCFL